MPIDACIEKVDIFLSARALPKIPIMSETDAFAVLLMKDSKTKSLVQIGMTVSRLCV